MTIWSLSDEIVFHINLPKEACPGLDFSVGGAYMAVTEKRKAKDYVGVYSCNSWTPVTVCSYFILFQTICNFKKYLYK